MTEMDVTDVVDAGVGHVVVVGVQRCATTVDCDELGRVGGPAFDEQIDEGLDIGIFPGIGSEDPDLAGEPTKRRESRRGPLPPIQGRPETQELP